jgi:hypothetical protein
MYKYLNIRKLLPSYTKFRVNFGINYSKNTFKNFTKLNKIEGTENLDEILDKDEEKLNYDFLEQKNFDFIKKNSSSIQINEELNKIAKEMKCKGCGINLQIENPEKIGFIPEKKFIEFFDKKEKNNKSDEQYSNPREKIQIREFEQINNPETLNRIMKLKEKPGVLICERCYKLKHYNNFENLNTTKNRPNQNQTQKIENYTHFVKQINTEKLIQQIMMRISEKAHIFYICVNN